MIINRNKITNPFLVAYIDKFNYADGTEIRNIDYMFWIDRKHTEYRKFIGYPEDCSLTEEMIPSFIEWLKTSEEEFTPEEYNKYLDEKYSYEKKRGD